MAKKQFKSNFQDIFSPTQITDQQEKVFTSMEEKDEVQRTTLLLCKSTYSTIKAIAFWERKQIKDVINDAFTLYLSTKSKEEIEVALREFKDH